MTIDLAALVHSCRLVFSKMEHDQGLHVEMLDRDGAHVVCASLPLDWLNEVITDGTPLHALFSDWKCVHDTPVTEDSRVNYRAVGSVPMADVGSGSDVGGNATSGDTASNVDDDARAKELGAAAGEFWQHHGLNLKRLGD